MNVWYFDFISPFAYLQIARHDLSDLQFQPVLLAGLLSHHGSKGPAEIPGKRVFTYQHCLWMAQKAGVPMRFPPAHPFNPLKALRLALACACRPDAVRRIFDFIWVDGGDLDDATAFADLAASLSCDPTAIDDPVIKRRLIEATQAAASANVFGVPTIAIGERLFWGLDATEMARAFQADPAAFDQGEMGRVRHLPVGATRR